MNRNSNSPNTMYTIKTLAGRKLTLCRAGGCLSLWACCPTEGLPLSWMGGPSAENPHQKERCSAPPIPLPRPGVVPHILCAPIVSLAFFSHCACYFVFWLNASVLISPSWRGEPLEYKNHSLDLCVPSALRRQRLLVMKWVACTFWIKDRGAWEALEWSEHSTTVPGLHTSAPWV